MNRNRLHQFLIHLSGTVAPISPSVTVSYQDIRPLLTSLLESLLKRIRHHTQLDRSRIRESVTRSIPNTDPGDLSSLLQTQDPATRVGGDLVDVRSIVGRSWLGERVVRVLDPGRSDVGERAGNSRRRLVNDSRVMRVVVSRSLVVRGEVEGGHRVGTKIGGGEGRVAFIGMRRRVGTEEVDLERPWEAFRVDSDHLALLLEQGHSVVVHTQAQVCNQELSRVAWYNQLAYFHPIKSRPITHDRYRDSSKTAHKAQERLGVPDESLPEPIPFHPNQSLSDLLFMFVLSGNSFGRINPVSTIPVGHPFFSMSSRQDLHQAFTFIVPCSPDREGGQQGQDVGQGGDTEGNEHEGVVSPSQGSRDHGHEEEDEEEEQREEVDEEDEVDGRGEKEDGLESRPSS